jgi:NADH-quinone oxidoreductase subunit H
MLMTLARSVFARLRIDQMMELCWKYIAPMAFVQLVVVLIVKGVFLK